MTDAAIYFREDDIAALSTPPGRGAVAVIRLSGPSVIALVRRVFKPRGRAAALSPRRMIHGALIDPRTGEAVDDAMAVIFPAPRSFSGEDMAELHTHGGEAVVRQALALLYREGARPAEPGEFTFRAVRNGKLDLAQAEAIAALIDSRSQLARTLSLRMLEGAFSRDLAELREDLISILVELETLLEFPDDAMEESLCEALHQRTDALLAGARRLQSRAVREQRFEQGVAAVLAGRPNVGKSSLFNRLLGRDRAIVTPHAGTTRDALEGTIELQGRPVTLIDTAGLRQTHEEIEAIGVERSRSLLNDSPIALFVIDARMGLIAEEERMIQDLCQRNAAQVILVVNKWDLQPHASLEEMTRNIPTIRAVNASAVNEDGIDDLLSALEEVVTALIPVEADSAYLINARQERILAELMEHFVEANRLIAERAPLELCSEELRAALGNIAHLDGSGVAPDLMSLVFSRFCIGK